MFRQFLLLTFASPSAVTTVETSNMYQIMLMIILIMHACVVCVDAYAFLHAGVPCLNTRAHMVVCVNSPFFSVNTVFI